MAIPIIVWEGPDIFMLTATLAQSNVTALSNTNLLAYRDDQIYGQLMAHTVPHPQHGAVLVRPGDSGLVYHPLRGVSAGAFSFGIRETPLLGTSSNNAKVLSPIA